MVINYKFLFPLIAFLGTVAITTLRPVLVLYVRNFGFSAFLIGFIPAVYMLLRGVFSFFSGSISDRIGKRKIFLYIGTGLSILGTILLFSIETFKLYFTGTHIYLLVLFCRFLQGLSAGILWPIAQVMVLESSPDNKKAFYMALYFNSGVLGFIISDFLIAILGKLNASLNAFLYISVLLLFF
jgi:MFS family permease